MTKQFSASRQGRNNYVGETPFYEEKVGHKIKTTSLMAKTSLS